MRLISDRVPPLAMHVTEHSCFILCVTIEQFNAVLTHKSSVIPNIEPDL